jgi:hypothetical protein
VVSYFEPLECNPRTRTRTRTRTLPRTEGTFGGPGRVRNEGVDRPLAAYGILPEEETTVFSMLVAEGAVRYRLARAFNKFLGGVPHNELDNSQQIPR